MNIKGLWGARGGGKLCEYTILIFCSYRVPLVWINRDYSMFVLIRVRIKSKRAFIQLKIKIITLHSLGVINLKIMFTCPKTLSEFTLVLYEILLIGRKDSLTEAS